MTRAKSAALCSGERFVSSDGGHAMTADCYRFYLQRDGQTFAAEVLECDSDAMAKAKELLAGSTMFYLMEVWQGTRKVGIVERS